MLDYFRLSADKRLIFGGGVVYGARDPAHVESIIRPKMLRAFPQLEGKKIEFGWTGNSCSPCLACRKWAGCRTTFTTRKAVQATASPFTHLAGRLLGEAIRGQAERFDAFGRLPPILSPGAISGCLSRPLVRCGTRCGIDWGFKGS